MKTQVIGQTETDMPKLAKQALRWLRKQLLPGHATNPLRDLRVVERLAVGPKQYVVVVECAGERVLVGTSVQGVQTMLRLEGTASSTMHPARRAGNL